MQIEDELINFNLIQKIKKIERNEKFHLVLEADGKEISSMVYDTEAELEREFDKLAGHVGGSMMKRLRRGKF